MKRQTQTLTLSIVLTASIIGLISCQKPPDRTTVSEPTTSKPVTPQKGAKVRPGYDAPPLRMVAEVVDIGLNKLGYDVQELKQISSAALLYAALAADDIDFTAVDFERSYANYFENGGGSAKLDRLGAISPYWVQGYQVDKKTAEQYKLTKLEQLKDPKIAKIFDSQGDGKAHLTGCEAGWGCDKIIEHHLDVYGLRNTVKQDQGSFTTIIPATLVRYKEGKPILLYNWIPSWQSEDLKVGKDVVWLAVPFSSIPKDMGNVTDKDTLVDGKNLGFPRERLRVVALNKFLAANPVAKRWFELVQIPLADINMEMKTFHDGQNSPQQIRQHAEAWVKKNQKLFDGWLEEAKKAKI